MNEHKTKICCASRATLFHEFLTHTEPHTHRVACAASRCVLFPKHSTSWFIASTSRRCSLWLREATVTFHCLQLHSPFCFCSLSPSQLLFMLLTALDFFFSFDCSCWFSTVLCLQFIIYYCPHTHLHIHTPRMSVHKHTHIDKLVSLLPVVYLTYIVRQELNSIHKHTHTNRGCRTHRQACISMFI